MNNDNIDKNNNKSIVSASYWKNNIISMQYSYNFENNCPICFNQITTPKETECKHIMCMACLDKWLFSHNTCPICRQIQKKIIQHKKNTSTSNLEISGSINGDMLERMRVFSDFFNLNRYLNGFPPLTYST